MRQIKLVDMGGRRQRVQGNRLRIIRIQIPFGTGTFLGHAGGVRGDDAKLVVSRDIDEKHLQKVMAYLFVTILFLFDFAKHQLGKVQQMLFFSGIIIVTVVLRGLRTAEGEGQSLNAEYDVLQRFGIHGFFRVFHVGINDDHVVFLNRDQLVFYQEFSQAADDIEQLGEVWGRLCQSPSYLEVEAYRSWKFSFWSVSRFLSKFNRSLLIEAPLCF